MKIWFNWKFVATLVFFMANITTGQESWTLDKCLEYAYQNSPRLKVAQKSIEEAEGQAQSSAAILYPQLNFSSSYTKNSPSPLGGLAGNVPGRQIRPSLVSADVYEHSFGLNYTFFSWKIKPTLEIASANLGRLKTDFRQTKSELTLEVKKAYYTVMFTDQLVKIGSQAEEVAKNNYETTEKLYKEGKVSHFDVSRSKVRWVNGQSDLIEAKNNYQTTLEALRTFMSLPSDIELNLSGSLSKEMLEISMEEALNQAYVNRPELQSLSFLEKVSSSTINLEKAARLPSFTLTYNYGWQANDLYSDPDKYFKYWTFLGKISLPIFDGFTARGRIKAAKASLERVKDSKEQLQDLIDLEVRQAFLTFQAAKDRILAQRENVNTA